MATSYEHILQTVRGHRLRPTTDVTQRHRHSPSLHRFDIVTSRSVAESQRLSRRAALRRRSDLHGPCRECRLSLCLRATRASSLGPQTNALVHLQAFRRLLSQQNSRRTVSTVAVNDPRALWRARYTRNRGVDNRATLDLVSDRGVALHARGACCCFDQAQSCLLFRLTPAKPRTRCDDYVAAGGARCSRDHRQRSVVAYGLFSLEQEGSGGGRQWRLKAVASYSSPTTECLTRSARARCCRTCASWRSAECGSRC